MIRCDLNWLTGWLPWRWRFYRGILPPFKIQRLSYQDISVMPLVWSRNFDTDIDERRCISCQTKKTGDSSGYLSPFPPPLFHLAKCKCCWPMRASRIHQLPRACQATKQAIKKQHKYFVINDLCVVLGFFLFFVFYDCLLSVAANI